MDLSALNDWFFHTQWFGNTAFAWSVAVLGAVLGYALVHGAIALLAARLKWLARQRPGALVPIAARVLEATRGWLLLLLALAIALHFLDLPDRVQARLDQAVSLLVGLQVALWLTRLIRCLVEQMGQTDGASAAQHSVLSGILSWTAQLVVWTVLLLAVLSNAGVNVNAFIASLGVGGVAVALAAQNVLGDLFASISIGLDKPFEVGEFIAIGDDSGTVQRVGIKSTRIQSLSGEELAIGNAQLLSQRVRNYSRMSERRVVFGFRVAVDTPRERVERIVRELGQFIGQLERVRLDRGHMTGFGEYSLDFEFVYYVLDPGFAVYRDIQQRINFQVMELLERLGVRLAVPARVLHDGATAPQAATSANAAPASQRQELSAAQRDRSRARD